MKRLLRILRSLFTILCFILFVATAVFYFRSQRHLDEFNIYRPLSYRSIWSVEGRFYVFLWSAPRQFWGVSRIGFGGGELSRLNYNIPMSHKIGPFGYNVATSTNPALVMADGWIIMFPHWIVLLLSVLPPAFGLRRYLKKRSARFRAAHGLCLRCGYDLRSTPSRCPECGFENSAPDGA